MDPFWITRQMVDFQRSAFDHAYQTTALLQEHMEKVTSTAVHEIGWLPEDGKRMIEEWTGSCRKGRNEMKKAIDEQFEAFSGTLCQTAPAKSAQ
jgi:predicted urease superfamily metal-dependent hydrolase